MLRYRTYFLAVFVIFLGCTQEGDSPESQFDVSEDTEGNLLILNRLNAPILLYINGEEEPLKEIGAKEDFLVNISSNGTAPTLLRVLKKSQVLDPFEPELNDIYKEWNIVLPNSLAESDQVTWVITSGSSSTAVGQLSFNYPSTDVTGNLVIYEASIYLNNKNGKKITSVSPGKEDKIVGLDFGYYYLYYKYSFEGPNNSEMVGWIELDSLGNALNTLLNAGTPTQNIEVPIYYLSDVGRLGFIEITNQTSNDLKIFLQNDIQIEDVVVTDQSSYGLSIVEGFGGSYNYLLPQNNYQLTAKILGTGEIVANRENVSVIELYNASWTISDTIAYRDITIRNNIVEPITIHNEHNNDYLGFYVPGEDTISYLVADSITSLVARNLTATKETFYFGESDIWDISFLNPNFHLQINDSANIDGATFNSSEITLSWELGSSAVNLMYQLQNAEYGPYSDLIYDDSTYQSITYKYLDESKNDESYVFRINSNSIDGSEFGWQEVSFQIDAIGSNGIYIYPRQQVVTINTEFSFDIMLEEIDNARSIYVELEYDKESLNVVPDSISLGSVFSNCESSLLLLNDNPNQFGILKISISFLGNVCNGFEGSGDLVSVKMVVVQVPLNNESLIRINNNSSFRDLENNEIDISNINSSSSHVSRVSFP